MTFQYDADGVQLCQLCGMTCQDSPWVLLNRFKVSNGVRGWMAREYIETDEDGEPLDADMMEDRDPDEYGGAVLHLTCVEGWLWGLAIEAQHVAEQAMRGAE